MEEGNVAVLEDGHKDMKPESSKLIVRNNVKAN